MKWGRTFVELPAESGSEAPGHVSLAIHSSFNHVIVLDDERDLGVTVALRRHLEIYIR